MKDNFFYKLILFLAKNALFVVFLILIISFSLSFFIFYKYVIIPTEREYLLPEKSFSLDEDLYEKILEKWEEDRDILERNIFRR